jgi:hypothetical protein
LDLVLFPFALFVIGPLIGMGVARLVGRLTWPRVLLASALATTLLVLVSLAMNDGVLGMPQRIYTSHPPELRPGWREYLWMGVPVSLLGVTSGAILFGLGRLVARIGRSSVKTAPPPA